MIPRTIPTVEAKDWKKQLRDAHISAKAAADFLQLPVALFDNAAMNAFALVAPHAYLSKIEKGNPVDPLLLQILPEKRELEISEADMADPLQENLFSPYAGLIHKYDSRVLFVFGSHCAINCRYCFRREFPYSEHTISRHEWRRNLEYIAHQPAINEVILSGGDPLAVNTKQLAWLTKELIKIPHIKRLRIHTRLPVVIPDRIDPEFLDWVDQVALPLIMVLHVNHPNEIDTVFIQMAKSLKDRGVTLLNQSVLLANVNDHADTLTQLSERLFDAGIQPYYLHLMDDVKGARHFHFEKEKAKKIYQELQEKLPGFLVPRLVKEIPGKKSKTIMSF